MAKAKREKRDIKAIGGFYAFSLVEPLLCDANTFFNATPCYQSSLRDDWIRN
jgi:hypothetical protein